MTEGGPSSASAPAARLPPETAAFVALSLAAAIVPLAESSEAIGASDVGLVAAVLAVVLGIEVLVVWAATLFAARYRRARALPRLLLASALFLNVGSFLAPLVNVALTYILVGLAVLAVAFQALATWGAARRAMVVFAVILAAISLGKAGYRQLVARPEAPVDAPSKTARAKPLHNVYVLGFDALGSVEGLRQFFGASSHPTAELLEGLGFRIWNLPSAGDDTLRTYGRMMSFGQDFNHLVARTFFNGLRPVPLYQRLRHDGFRIQFIYATEYFGIDAGRLDYFYPDLSSPLLCEFVDRRYGVFACREWFRALLERWFAIKVVARVGAEHEYEAEFERIRARFLAAAKEAPERWFSVAHFWFPGHSALTLSYDDAEAVEAYRRSYVAMLPQVDAYVRRIVDDIRRNDPAPVIVIFGDHGALVTRGARAGAAFRGSTLTDADLLLDRRGALLAIYPASFCSAPLSRRNDASMVLLDILDCLSAERTR